MLEVEGWKEESSYRPTFNTSTKRWPSQAWTPWNKTKPRERYTNWRPTGSNRTNKTGQESDKQERLRFIKIHFNIWRWRRSQSKVKSLTSNVSVTVTVTDAAQCHSNRKDDDERMDLKRTNLNWEGSVLNWRMAKSSPLQLSTPAGQK